MAKTRSGRPIGRPSPRTGCTSSAPRRSRGSKESSGTRRASSSKPDWPVADSWKPEAGSWKRGALLRSLEPATAVDRQVDEVVGRQILEAARLRALDEVGIDAVDPELDQAIDLDVGIAGI